MFLYSKKCVRSSGRSVSIRLWYLSANKRFKQLSVGFQKRKGRSASSGRRLTFSKGYNLHRNLFYVTSGGFLGLFVTSLVVGYQRMPQKSNLLALLCNAFGCWFYFPATSDVLLFGYVRVYSPTDSAASAFSTCRWPSAIANFPPHSSVCLLGCISGFNYFNRFIAGGIKFVRSPGSRATVLSTKFYTRWALILLPSKKFKVIDPTLTFACFSAVQPVGYANIIHPKAGFSRNMGHSPQVRGTVKNANDHPNGGRSRSLRCSRTPWGLTAKKSRRPKLA
jgi:hypothetical protein